MKFSDFADSVPPKEIRFAQEDGPSTSFSSSKFVKFSEKLEKIHFTELNLKKRDRFFQQISERSAAKKRCDLLIGPKILVAKEVVESVFSCVNAKLRT